MSPWRSKPPALRTAQIQPYVTLSTACKRRAARATRPGRAAYELYWATRYLTLMQEHLGS